MKEYRMAQVKEFVDVCVLAEDNVFPIPMEDEEEFQSKTLERAFKYAILIEKRIEAHGGTIIDLYKPTNS